MTETPHSKVAKLKTVLRNIRQIVESQNPFDLPTREEVDAAHKDGRCWANDAHHDLCAQIRLTILEAGV
jgi:hypothetical protein